MGWISSTVLSLYYPSLKAKYWNAIPGAALPAVSSFAPRQILLTAAVGLWSLRLGSFLAMVNSVNRDLSRYVLTYLQRAIKAGGDSRFDEIKKQPKKFTFFWMAQGAHICGQKPFVDICADNVQ